MLCIHIFNIGSVQGLEIMNMILFYWSFNKTAKICVWTWIKALFCSIL